MASFLGTYSFVPVVDGAFITESPIKTLRGGRVNGVRIYLQLSLSIFAIH